jgi:hypothetical protein
MRRYRPTLRSRTPVSVVVCCSLAAAALGIAAEASAAPKPPTELWQQFPLDGQGTTPAPEQTTPAPERTTGGAFRPPAGRASTTSSSAPAAAATSELSWLWIGVASALVGLALALVLRDDLVRVREFLTWLLRGFLARFPSRAKPRARRRLIRRPALPRPPMHAYALAHRRLPLSALRFSDSGREHSGGRWRLPLGRLRRGRAQANESAEPVPTERERPEREPEPWSSVELIRSYSAAPEPTAAEPAAAEPAAEEPEPSEPAAEELEAWKPARESEPEGPDDAVTTMVTGQVALARQTHHALTLVAVRFAESGDEAAPEPDELRERVEAAVRRVVVSTGEPQLALRDEEHSLWLALPGLLPRRAVDVADEIRRILNGSGLAPLAVAFAGYPRDGATAEELLEHCHAELEQAGRHALDSERPVRAARGLDSR